MCRPIVPEERVGGDFYDAVLLADGGVALLVGDASGKGLAASAATEVRYSLRAFLCEDPDPARAVSRVNDMLCRTAALENRAAGLTTLTLVVGDSGRGMGRLVHAGGEFPILIPADAGSDAREFEDNSGAGMALGITLGHPYTATDFPLGHGDMMLLFTDGITESRRGNSFFGTLGILNAIRNARSLSQSGATDAHFVVGDVLREANRFHAGTFRDEMCLFAAQVTH